MENKCSLIFQIQKNLLYYSMNKAYKKALQVVRSCKTSAQVIGAYNYIHNFRILFGHESGCKKLTETLMEQCATKRKLLGEI